MTSNLRSSEQYCISGFEIKDGSDCNTKIPLSVVLMCPAWLFDIKCCSFVAQSTALGYSEPPEFRDRIEYIIAIAIILQNLILLKQTQLETGNAR